MQTALLQNFIYRRPFRPFALRLNNGTQYKVEEERQVGAPADLHVVVYFGLKEVVMIDPESISEVIDTR